jgi:hypothetical protein
VLRKILEATNSRLREVVDKLDELAIVIASHD